ncbi:MAG TPA: hypothetical protein VJC14_02015 [Candidatus Paceibacterota bacterium]
MKINSWYILRLTPLLLFIGATVFFYYSSPEEIIRIIGIENAYVLMFVLALLGGLSTFSGVPYHVVLVMLASGGLNPLLVGISAASGVIVGDSTSYYLGYSGGAIIPQGIQKTLKKFCAFCLARPRVLPIAFFIYGSLVPFSNDFIVISMGLARYSFWRVMIPLGLGNFVFNISLAYLAVYAYSFLKSVFFYI